MPVPKWWLYKLVAGDLFTPRTRSMKDVFHDKIDFWMHNELTFEEAIEQAMNSNFKYIEKTLV